MNQGEADAVVGRLVRERSEAQKHLALLQSEARELSKLFIGLGEMVKPDKVWNISLGSYENLLSKETYNKIARLITGVREAENNLGRLNDELKKFDA